MLCIYLCYQQLINSGCPLTSVLSTAAKQHAHTQFVCEQANMQTAIGTDTFGTLKTRHNVHLGGISVFGRCF